MAERKIEVKFVGDASSIERSFGKVVKSSQQVAEHTAKMHHTISLAVGAFAGFELAGKATDFLKSSAEAAANDQAQMAVLANQVKNAGVSWKLHGEAISTTLDKMAETSGFIKTDLEPSYARIIGATHNVTKSTQLLGDAENLARARHISVVAAATLVTKVYDGNSAALKRLGVQATVLTTAQDKLKHQHDVLAASGHKFTLAEKEQYVEAQRAAKAQDKQASSIANLAKIHKSFAGASDAYSKTEAGQLARLSQTWERIKVQIGNVIIPYIANGLRWLVSAAQKYWPMVAGAAKAAFAIISTIVEKYGPEIRTILVAAFHDASAAVQGFVGWLKQNKDVVVALGVFVGTLAAGIAVFRTVMLAAAVATKIVTAAQWLLNAAMDLNPIGLVIVAVAGLAAALVVLYERSSKARAIINQSFTAIKAVASAVFGWIAGTGVPLLIKAWNAVEPVVKRVAALVGQYLEGVQKTIRGVVNFVGDLIHGRWSQLWDDAKQIVSGVIKAMGVILVGLPGLILSVLGSVGSAALRLGGRIVSSVLSGVGTLAGKVGSFLATLPGKIASFAGSIGTAALRLGEHLVSRIISGLSALPGEIYGLIRDAINGLIDRFNSSVHLRFQIDTGIPGVGKQGIDINPPNVPHLALGGIVRRPTVALIGEAGPEAVVPLSRAGGITPSLNVVVNVAGSVIGQRDLVELVRSGLVETLRANPSLFGAAR